MDDNMNNYFDEYDEDNIDLEKEMYEKDIEEEAAAEEEAEKNEEEQLENKKATELSKKLNLRNITVDLEKTEQHRQTYTFEKDNIIYKGIVISKLSKDRYVFNVTYKGCDTPKLKAFNLSDIIQ